MYGTVGLYFARSFEIRYKGFELSRTSISKVLVEISDEEMGTKSISWKSVKV
jgi:hypothetical protein